MFYVVQLDSDEFKEKMVVPSIWLDETNTFCLLPPVVDIVEIKRQAEAQTSTKHGWQMHNLSFIQSFDTFSEAKQNIEMNKNESVMIELDEEEEEDCLQRKDRERRKRKRPAFLENYVTETYGNEEAHETMQVSMEDSIIIPDSLDTIEDSIIIPDPLIIKQEPSEDTIASECQQQQTISCDEIMTNCRVLLDRNFQIPDSSSSKVSPTVNSMSTKCTCSSCHKMVFQSLAALRKQVEDNSCMLNEILSKLRTPESNSNAVSILSEGGASTDSSERPPTTELNKVVSSNTYSNDQRAVSETLHCPVQFGNFLLENGVDSSTVEILKDEGITGSTIVDVNESDLRELNIKMGPRKKILQIIKSYKTQVSTETENVQVSFPSHSPQSFNEAHCSSSSSSLPIVDKRLPRTSNEKPVASNNIPMASCGEISVRKWLEAHAQGQRLINTLDNEVYTAEDRCLLVRLVVREMIKICGSAYPSTEMKEQIAKQIVTEFPCLRSVRDNAFGHELLYDKQSGTGFLEYRLKTIRKHLSPANKRRRVKGSKLSGRSQKVSELKLFDSVLNTEDFEEKIVWMQLTNATEYHKSAIINALRETRANRQNEILSKKLTILEILDRYPRLADYNGEMIDREFKWLHPTAEDFVLKFSFYAVRILNYVEAKKPQLLPLVSDLDENLKALVLIPELLPAANYASRKKKQVKNVQKKYFSKILPHPHLMKFVNANEDFSTNVDTSSTEPYMVCARVGSQKTGKYFLHLDKKYLEVADNALTAFDLLFKSHFVFNVQYAEELLNFYDFVCACIYKIGVPNPSSDALNSCLLNVPVDLTL